MRRQDDWIAWIVGLCGVMLMSAGGLTSRVSCAQPIPGDPSAPSDAAWVDLTGNRGELLLSTALLGATEGFLLYTALAPNMPAEQSVDFWFPASMTAGAALGSVLPAYFTRNTPIADATPVFAGFGGLQGYLHSLQFIGIVRPDQLTRGHAALAFAMGGVEAAAGYWIGQRVGWSSPRARLAATSGLFGNALGVAAGFGMVPDATVRRIGTSSMLGSVAGWYGGAVLGRHVSFTAGDVDFYRYMGLVGASTAAAALYEGAGGFHSSGRTVALGLLGGTLAGLGTGTLSAATHDLSQRDSRLLALGGFVGGLVGELAVSPGIETSRASVVAAAIGQLAGVGLTYVVLRPARATGSRSASSSASVSWGIVPYWDRGAEAVRPQAQLSVQF